MQIDSQVLVNAQQERTYRIPYRDVANPANILSIYLMILESPLENYSNPGY